MAGLPTYTDADGTNGVDTNYVVRAQGLTSQNWAGPAMAAGSTALGNSYSGSTGLSGTGIAAPGYVGGSGSEPVQPAAGQPGGANVMVIPNSDGSAAAGANLQTVGANAGTAGGGSYYPNVGTGTYQVSNPMTASGWTIQNVGGSQINDDAPDITVVVNPQYGAVHAANTNNIFTPTLSGGTAAYTVVCVECVQTIAGVQSTLSAMPAGLTLTAASGAVANSTSSVAGTFQLGFRVSDSSSPIRYDEYEVTVVLS